MPSTCYCLQFRTNCPVGAYSLTGGHLEGGKVFEKVRVRFYWVGQVVTWKSGVNPVTFVGPLNHP